MDRHIFICGCGHSGTSLMANMFASHPKVFIPLRETEAFLDHETAQTNWAEVIAEARASGKSILAEKTPRHVHAVQLIRSLVPNAQFVVMMRDGRDVAASFIKRFGKAAKGRKRWVTDNEAILPFLGDADVYLQRYEDLIADPEAALRGVCAFTRISYAPEMLRFHETNRLWFGVEDGDRGDGRNGLEHRKLRNWQINQPIFDGRGAWRDLLDEDEIAAFSAGSERALLDRFGYAT